MPDSIRVALCPCSASKLSRPAPARELYTGDLTQKALAYATQPGLFDQVFILSARHHALRLDEVVEPYDRCLADLSREDRAGWGRVVMESLRALTLGAPHVELTFLVGESYRRPVERALTDFGPPWTLKAPLAGMGIGYQRRWLAVGTEAHGPRPLTATDRLILDALAAGPLERPAIQARTGRSVGVLASALARLKREGRVAGSGSGVWALAEGIR